MKDSNSQGSNSSTAAESNLIAGQPAPAPRTPLQVVPKPRVNPLRVVPSTTVPEEVLVRATNGVIFRRVVGQGVTRLIPLVGWGLLANDLAELAEQGIESLQPSRGSEGGNFDFDPLSPPNTPPSETVISWNGTIFPNPFSGFGDYVYGELDNGRGRTDGDVQEYNPSTNYDPPPTDISEPPVTPNTFPGQPAVPTELPFSEAPLAPELPDSTPRSGDIPVTTGGSFIPTPQPTEPGANPTSPQVLPNPPEFNPDRLNTDRPSPIIPGDRDTFKNPQRPQALPNPPGFNPDRLNIDQPGPSITGDRNTFNPKASQESEEPASETGEGSIPADPVIAEQEDKKAAVEEKVSELSDADRAINNLPSGLQEELRDVGYIIKQGDNPSIAYIGTTEHGKLPSGSQLHLKKGADGNRTIEQGPSAANPRIANTGRMKRNILKAAGLEKWPENVKLQAHHLITDKVSQESDLALEYARRNGGNKVVDDANNLLVAAENPAESRSRNSGVRTLLQRELMLKNITHFGSHPLYSDRVAQKLKDESDRLKAKYGTLDKVPKAEIDEAYLRVQNQMREELLNAGKEIGKGNFHKLPQEVQDYLTPAGGRNRKLSEVPTDRQNTPIASSKQSPQSLNPKNMSDLSKAIRSLTETFEAANTYSYNPNKIPVGTTPEAFAQTLATTMSKIMQGKNKNGEEITLAQSRDFRAERDKNSGTIKITHPQTGRRLATIDPHNNKITMQGMLSTQQIETLAGIQNPSQSTTNKSAQRELG